MSPKQETLVKDTYSTTEEYNQPITEQEVHSAIKSMRNSAPGPDQVHPAMLKNITPQQLTSLTLFLNIIWNSILLYEQRK